MTILANMVTLVFIFTKENQNIQSTILPGSSGLSLWQLLWTGPKDQTPCIFAFASGVIIRTWPCCGGKLYTIADVLTWVFPFLHGHENVLLP